jgi:hypothetical protein
MIFADQSGLVGVVDGSDRLALDAVNQARPSRSSSSAAARGPHEPEG